MTSFLVASIFLLGLSSLATAANFTQVFQWNEFDYEWPSEASRAQALEDGTYRPENFAPRFMAVYGSRIFLSFEKYKGVPVNLVSLPTSSASSASPKLTPFPSWDLHEWGNCSKMEWSLGLQVDSVGRLWVLDICSQYCTLPKLWIFNLNTNETELFYRFSHRYSIHDLVIDETPNGTFAYIAQFKTHHIVVFSLERNEAWTVDTPGINPCSIALSPKKETRQLYLGNWRFKTLHSISVAALRNGTRAAEPRLIENWAAINPYRMLMDNHGTLYTAFMWKNYTSTWNTSRPFLEQSFYQVSGLKSSWPFTFSLDQSGTFWMTAFDDENMPRFRLLKAAVGAKSYIYEDSPESRE
ncbi:protein yellow-like [Cloeon dipterum]|uniref:protein yellow-like n=1 Tax=Cloeon dipterum TaxID=197152 RepID=UPI00321F648B